MKIVRLVGVRPMLIALRMEFDVDLGRRKQSVSRGAHQFHLLGSAQPIVITKLVKEFLEIVQHVRLAHGAAATDRLSDVRRDFAVVHLNGLRHRVGGPKAYGAEREEEQNAQHKIMECH